MYFIQRLELKAGYQVSISAENEELKAKVQHTDSKREWEGVLKGFSFKDLLWIANHPSLFKGRLYINQKTLEVQTYQGLFRASITARQIQIEKDRKNLLVRFGNLDQQLLNNNQKKAAEITSKITMDMMNGYFEQEIINELSRFRPYECGLPMMIVQNLFEKIMNPNIWKSCSFTYNRQKLTKRIRKFRYGAYYEEWRRSSFSERTEGKDT